MTNKQKRSKKTTKNIQIIEIRVNGLTPQLNVSHREEKIEQEELNRINEYLNLFYCAEALRYTQNLFSILKKYNDKNQTHYVFRLVADRVVAQRLQSHDSLNLNYTFPK